MTLNRPIRRYWNPHNPRIDGQKVRELRLEAGMTQQELAEAIGVTERSIRNWETVGGPMRDAGNIAYRLGRVFGVERIALFAANRHQPGL